MGRGNIICVTGIDTDIGKSIVTGLLARYLLEKSVNVITQKLCQTGCRGISEDILLHRQIMGIELTEADQEGLTCPYVFAEPCSPHLAASLENISIRPEKLTDATERLGRRYEVVILEGVGGLMVPLQDELLLADYLQEFDYHHLLVSSPKLGSINHTLSALEVMRSRKMELLGIVYNRYFESNEVIADDTRKRLLHYLPKYGYRPEIVDIPRYEKSENSIVTPDFSRILGKIF